MNVLHVRAQNTVNRTINNMHHKIKRQNLARGYSDRVANIQAYYDVLEHGSEACYEALNDALILIKLIYDKTPPRADETIGIWVDEAIEQIRITQCAAQLTDDIIED